MGSVFCCMWCARFMVPRCFQNHWHHRETGWQKWKVWSWGAKCALACEMEGWGVGSEGRHEGRGWGEGVVTETAGQGGRRGGVESLVWRVAAKPTVMLATGIGCCGPQVVLVCTSKGQAVNMKTQLIFPPSIPSFASATLLFSLALRLSFSSSFPWGAHPRCCRIFELRRRDSMPAGLPRQSAVRTRERKGKDRSGEKRWPAAWQTQA